MVFRTSRPHATRVRLFRNHWLELTTLTPFPVFVSIWSPIILFTLVMACQTETLSALIIGFPCGLLAWSLFEYAAHRYVFHLSLKSVAGQKFIFLLHGNHHADPQDPLRSIMPLTVTLPLGLLIWLGCWGIGFSGHTSAFAGFVCGYILYDTLHWAAHQASPRNRIGRYLKRHHQLHHHSRLHGNYATTTPVLDRLFRTRIQRR
ncbi:sterol desaturase family protein [Gluconobacter wancherniae]|nr:sterol desaturase family protein [Gluconobacter wancherniae]MBS1063289.1 sterol desaturase family protein [Gluconobacter wancherniae]MBS1093978.1 sterol desaturase family protein [Gluconobacter wancherniae]